MKDIVKKILRSMGIMVVICVFIAGLIEACLVIDEDHSVTLRDGINERVINLLDVGSVSQELFINKTHDINISTLIVADNSEKINGYLCWNITGANNQVIYGKSSISDYEYGTWTNMIIDASAFKGSEMGRVNIWPENIQGVESIQFIVSESEQGLQYGNLYVSNEKSDGALVLTRFSFRGFKACLFQYKTIFLYLMLFSIILSVCYLIIKKEPIIILLLIRWVVDYIMFQPYTNYNNQFGYTLWMYSFQKLGLTTRIFPGSILKLFCNQISRETMLNAGLFCQIVSIIVLSIIFYHVLANSNKINNEALNLMLLIYIASPVFISYYLRPNSFLHYDELLLVFFVICLMLSGKEFGKCRFLVPFICGCAMLTHEMFILLCYPWLFSYLTYVFIKSKKKEDGYVLFSSAFIVVVLFLCTVLMQIKTNDLDSLLGLLQSDVKEEGLISSFYVSSYYVTSTRDKLILDHYDAFRTHAFTYLLLGLLVSFPLFHIAARFFYRIAQKSKCLLQRLAIFLFPLSLLGVVVACYKACDFGRWIVLSCACMILVILFMLYTGDEAEAKSMEYAVEPYRRILGNKWKYVILIYLALIGEGGIQGLSKLPEYLIRFLK